MKRILSGILIVTMMLSVCACGTPNNVVESSESIAESSEPTYSSFDWPTSDIAKIIPVPVSSIGKIDWEASYGFVIYVAETSKDDYDEYASQCEEAGFTVNYDKGDDYFMGDNADGYHVSLSYEEGDVMFIRMDEPKTISKEENNNANTVSSDGTTSSAASSIDSSSDSTNDKSDVTPEFKALMDSYEVFFDEYVEFMKKYKTSDDQAAMMTDMSDYMTKYADVMSKLDAVDNSNLSVVDSAYYVTVSGRIMKKLAEVA
ncbi:MAG: DUF6591 domain-containing protein [Candidatus Fimivivens sp.]